MFDLEPFPTVLMLCYGKGARGKVKICNLVL